MNPKKFLVLPVSFSRPNISLSLFSVTKCPFTGSSDNKADVEFYCIRVVKQFLSSHTTIFMNIVL
jgi:hypothetical protein